MEASVGDIVGWILQLKEIIALATLVLVIYHLLTKLIPFLLLREGERAERDAARSQANHDSMAKCIDKLDDTMRNGLDHIKEAMIDKLDDTMRNGLDHIKEAMVEVARTFQVRTKP